MAVSLPLLGENCAQVGISAQDLVEHQLPVLPISSLNKGIVYELNVFRNSCSFSWSCFYEWLTLILGDTPPLILPCVKTAISRLNKKHSELSRNKHGDQIILLFQEPFFSQQSTCTPTTEQQEREQSEVREQHKVVAKAHSKLSVRNVNKKLKCRDEKVKQCKSEIADLSKENQVLHSRLTTAQRMSEKNHVALSRLNQEQDMVSTEKKELDSKLQELEDRFAVHINSLDDRIGSLSCALDTARHERDELAERLTELESQKLKTKQHRQLYLDGVCR